MCTTQGLSDEDMVAKAQGTDVLPPAEVQRLVNAATKVKYKKLKIFFNTRDGWLLRRIARGHHIVRTSRQHCGLCGHNIKVAQRPKTSAVFSLCCIPLCTIPRQGESGLCCFEEWHAKDVLEPRVYPIRSHQHGNKSAQEHNTAPSPDENEDDNEDLDVPEPEPETTEPNPAVEKLRRERAEAERLSAQMDAAEDDAAKTVRK